MKFLHCLITAILFLTGSSAWANWRDDNPNQPNGYAASMYRYHHGTPDDDGPHDGYQASMFREKHGLDNFLPPDKDGGGRDGGDSSWGGGRWGDGGSGLGRHFRQGQAEGEAYWKQHLQQRMPQTMYGSGMNNAMQAAAGNRFNQMQEANMAAQRAYPNNYGTAAGFNTSPGGATASGTTYGAGYGANAMQNCNAMPAYPNAMRQNELMQQRFNLSNTQFGNQASANYQYSPTPNNFSNYNSTALRTAVTQRPVATLLRDSRGGFTRIYGQ